MLYHTQVQTTARYAPLTCDTVKVSVARIGDSIERYPETKEDDSNEATAR